MRQPWLTEFTAETNAERYRKSPWAYACVRARTDCLPSVEFVAQVWDSENQVWVRDRNHPVEERFDDPNPYQSQHELVSTNITDMCIAGNALTSVIDATNPASKREKRFTLRLEALHADYVRPVVDTLDVFAGYAVLKQGWALVGRPPTNDLIPVRNMVHAKLINPNDPLWGLSPLQVASSIMDAEAAAIEWNKSLIENGAKASMVLSTDQPLTKSQWEELIEMLEESYSGASVYCPMLLSHGLKYVKDGSDPVELDFVDSAYLEATRTCAALRTPPPIIGISKDATLANLVEYKKLFWTDGIIPDIERMLGAYNRSWVWPRWGKNVRLWYDLSKVAALQEDMSLDQKVTTGQKLLDMGYTLNEVNDRMQLGMPTTVLGNIRYGQQGRLPMFNEDIAPSINTVTDEEKSAPYSEAGKVAYWKNFETAREAHYARVEREALALVKADVIAFADLVRKGGVDRIDAFTAEREKKWEDLVTSTWRNVGEEFFRRKQREIEDQVTRKYGSKNTEPSSFWDQARAAFVKTYVGKKISSITKTTRDWVVGVIGLGTQRGDTLDTIANQIETLGPGFGKDRSYTISRTEVIGASNYASWAAADASTFVTRKQWISSRDERVRDSHQRLDGETQELKKPYSNGLMFPGDPRGTVSELVKCRCVESYIVD